MVPVRLKRFGTTGLNVLINRNPWNHAAGWLSERARRGIDAATGSGEGNVDHDFGLEHDPGGPHYRAYVGPPADYDLIAGSTFSLMFAAGLRETHHLLDLGCGSLRVGRLLIPYLRPDRYCGIEPNKWLVEEALRQETGRDLVALKRPRFSASDNFDATVFGHKFDWVVAQSIFSHTFADLASSAFERLTTSLSSTGVLIGTFQEGEAAEGTGWLYPACVGYKWEIFQDLLGAAGLAASPLDWPHPRQRWFVAGLNEDSVEMVREKVAGWPGH